MRSIPPAPCNSALKRSPPCTSKRSWTVSARTVSYTHLDVYKRQLPIHAIPGLDTLQFFQNGGQLVPQGLIHPGVALYHHIPAQQPSGDVVLFGKAGEPHSGFNFPVLILSLIHI